MRLLAFVSLLCLSLVSAFAQVQARLQTPVTSFQPGQPFTVALELTHQDHWHTYWINPGTGYATSLTWTLPPGWQASDIHWPTPIVIKDHLGNITGNGYEGVTLLPVTITPAADAQPGQTYTLSAKAEWLMCAEQCVPGDAQVQLSLPASAAPTTPQPTLAARFAAIPLPVAPTQTTFSAHREGQTLVLTATPAGDWRLPRVFSVDETVQYDQAQTFTSTPEGARFVLPVSPALSAPPTRLQGVLAYQDTSGALQGIALDLPLMATPPPAPNGNASGLLATLSLAFIGGLILNLMPCVFPVLGIKILGFVNQAGEDRRQVSLHGLAFTAGVLLSFWALAGALALLRSGGDQLGWGFQLQSPAFVFGLAIVMLVFALSMSGLFEFGLSATGLGANLQMKSGLSGSFFTGVLATVVATPCSAPFLAPALGAALTLPIIEGFAVFTAIAIGLSLPYLLLSLFPSAVRVLPRPGAWMETFKQAMAFPLYATVGYLVWVLAGQLSEAGLLNALLALVLVAAGTWVYGRFHTFAQPVGWRRFGLLGGLGLLALGAWFGWPQKPQSSDLSWQPWSPAAVTAARAEGKTIYVDFTARWCATCQANKKVVFGSKEIKDFVRAQDVVLLKADWTNRDDAITQELARFQRSAVPLNLVYKPGQPEPTLLPELLTPQVVLEALR